MTDDTKKKQPWLGKHTFPLIWIWTCVFFNVFGILSHIMLIIAEFVVLASDFTNYVKQYGHNYASRQYQLNAGCGFVPYTNAPTHLGSAIWTLFYQLSVIILSLLTVASDLAWRTAQSEWGGRYVSAFFAVGIMSGEHNKGLFYYVVANGFLKLFIVVLYMSQSFYGLGGGSHSFPNQNSGITWSTSSSSSSSISGSSASSASSDSSASSSAWRRGGWVIPSSSGHDPNSSWGTELWAFWAGWTVLGSIIPSIIAFMFLVPWSASKKEEKSSAESASSSSSSSSSSSGSGRGSSKTTKATVTESHSSRSASQPSSRSASQPSSRHH